MVTRIIRPFAIAAGCLLLPFLCSAQCLSVPQAAERLLSIKDAKISDAERLTQGLALQQMVVKCSLPKDSTYAYLLHLMGRWAHSSGRPNEAIAYTQEAAKINSAKNAAANPQLAVASYFNLGFYSQKTYRYQNALAFYDACVRGAGAFTDSATRSQTVKARAQKADIYFTTGDYGKAVEEASMGIPIARSINYRLKLISLLNARAQARAALLRINEAKSDANEAALLMTSFKPPAAAENDYAREQAYNLKIKADISEADGQFSEAVALHKKGIQTRSLLKDTVRMADGYLNAGNTVRRRIDSQKGTDFSSAKALYTTALALAQKKNYSAVIIKALNNLAVISFGSKAFTEALQGYHKSLLQTVAVFKDVDPTKNPSHNQCYTVSDKNALSTLLANKTECLLNLYKQSGSRQYLDAALKTALLTDSLIADMRHEQTGEQSKLYWRNETREFFTNALEACHEARNPALALHFMEKSRAVLLNDRLAELGAAATLPAAEAAKEQALQNDVFTLQQRLAGLTTDDAAYSDVQLKLFAAREDMTRFLQNTEARFPSYYQYKYADAVPSLPQMQRYLTANQQSFVDYFITDSTVYTLLVTPSSASIQKQKKENLTGALALFLKTCSNPQLLNSQYNRFAEQAYALYQILIKPLALRKGRVIVCSDGAVIPFEALTTDAEGRNFLINDYGFSYVYSAQSLLKKFSNPSGDGNFLGIAPGSYAAHLSVPSLQGALATLQASSAFYNDYKFLAGADANRVILLTYLPRYSVVAVLSHARADSTDNEPIIFMADSVIRLSELQLLQRPSTALVVLSACQTNVGKYATGEGVFSLTRGFASAGIPSITATLWKADEEAIYAITQTFLKNIAAGMQKDEALRQAKQAYMQGSSKAKLPYYWANMVLAGNTEPVILTKKNYWGWWIMGAVAIAVLGGLLIVRRRKKVA